MIALFNKAGKGIEEFREHIPYIDASERYTKLSSYIERESNAIRALISPALYDRSRTHYLSADYKVEYQADADKIKLDRLVYLIQSPTAIFGYLKFAPNNDIIHSVNGRRTHFDDNSRPAQEWQIDRAESNQFDAGHTAINDLLQYIEEEREVFTEWKNSDQRKEQRAYFIQNVEQWMSVHPLGSSPWLLIKCRAFFIDYMDIILSVVGSEKYEALLTKLKENSNLETADKTLLRKIQKPLGKNALSRALRELPVQFIPDGIVQNYVGDRNVVKARGIAPAAARITVAQELEIKAKEDLRQLEEHITSLEPVVIEDEETTSSPSCEDEFFMP